MSAFTVFVTAKRIALVREAVKQIQGAGFIVRTREEVTIPSLDSAGEEQDQTGTVAARTIDAIMQADAMVQLNGADWGRAMHEERAIAVAFDTPVIVVDSGHYGPSTALDFHPSVRPYRSVTVEEAIARAVALRDGTSQPPQAEQFLPEVTPVPAEPAEDGEDAGNAPGDRDQGFDRWMKEVDQLVEARFQISIHDLPEMQSRHAFDNGVTPEVFFKEDVIALVREEFGAEVLIINDEGDDE